MYALSRHTIGVSSQPVEEWAGRALREGAVKVEETADRELLLRVGGSAFGCVLSWVVFGNRAFLGWLFLRFCFC